MPDEVTNTSSNEVKTTSDGTVKISVEKYNELLEKAATKPPVINRTEVIKTPEMLAAEYRMWGGGFMGVGGSMFIIGMFLYKVGRSKSQGM
jgi:hypothetical protein